MFWPSSLLCYTHTQPNISKTFNISSIWCKNLMFQLVIVRVWESVLFDSLHNVRIHLQPLLSSKKLQQLRNLFTSCKKAPPSHWIIFQRWSPFYCFYRFWLMWEENNILNSANKLVKSLTSAQKSKSSEIWILCVAVWGWIDKSNL